MRCPKCNFDDFLKANGIELLPFQTLLKISYRDEKENKQ